MGYDLSRPTHSYSRKFQKPIMCPCFNHKAICVYIRRHIAIDGRCYLHIWWWVLVCINLVRARISVALSMSNVQRSKVTQYVCACSGCDHRSYWTFFPANFNLASLNESGQRGTPRCFAISYGRYVIWDLSLNILFEFMPRIVTFLGPRGPLVEPSISPVPSRNNFSWVHR